MAGKISLTHIGRPETTAEEVAEVVVQLDQQQDPPDKAQLERVGITEILEGTQPSLLLIPRLREAWLDGRCVASLKRSKLLYRLLETIAVHGRTMDRSALYEHVWELPYREPHSDNSLYVALNRLRKQLDGLEIEVLLESRYALASPHAVVQWEVVSSDVRAAVPHNLPAKPDQFIGRDEELQAISAAFDGGARLVTLRGSGGTGKTRLAAEYGHIKLSGDLAVTPVVRFCDLTNARTMDELLSQIAQTLGVAGSGWKGAAAGIDHLGAQMEAQGSLLLILDNLEQVIAHTPETVGVWLDRVPGLRMLVTSRERLRLPGEQVIVVGPLRLPLATELDALADSPAVALFVERASAVATGFALTEDNAAHVRGIVAVLDGLPLAIELAAARVPLISPKRLAERLAAAVDDPLKPSPSYDGLLAADRRGAPDKTAALRGSITWSWALLEPWEQAAMCQLSVFRGGFFLESAEAVLDLSDTPQAPRPMAVIGALVDQSMLHSRMVSGRLRFDILTSIREYAAEQHEATGPSAAHLRHATHFATLGSREHLVEVRRGTAEDCRQLAVEIDNLRAGVEIGLVAGDPAAAGCLTAALASMTLSGPLNTALVPVDEVLKIPGVGLADQSRIQLIYGVLLFLGGRTDESIAAMETACALGRESGNSLETAWALGSLGNVRRNQGRLDEAMEMFEEALALHEEVGSRRGRGRSIGSIASLHKIQGDLVTARQLYNEALVEHRACGDGRDLASGLAQLSRLDIDAGRLSQARESLETAVELYRTVEDVNRQAISLVTLGELAVAEDDLDQAQARFEAAVRIFREMGAHMNLAVTLADLGEVVLMSGAVAEADVLIQEGLDIAQRYRGPTGGMKGMLGLVRLRQGEHDEARSLFAQAQEEIGESDLTQLGIIMCRLAELEHLDGFPEKAGAARARAQEIADAQDLGPGSALRRILAKGPEA